MFSNSSRSSPIEVRSEALGLRLAVEYREKAQLALKQLAVAAGFLIWVIISGMIIAVIFMVFLQYLSMITSNLPK